MQQRELVWVSVDKKCCDATLVTLGVCVTIKKNHLVLQHPNAEDEYY